MAAVWGSAITGWSRTSLMGYRSRAARSMASIPKTANPHLFMAASPVAVQADVAHTHHSLLIKSWAQVIYKQRLSDRTLVSALGWAAHRLSKCTSPWAVTSCAPSAFLVTCARLKWTVRSPYVVCTNDGT
eukprot:5924451-Amphidinium_carterae.1